MSAPNSGAPPVTLVGITIRNSLSGPAIVVHGGRVTIDGCLLENNPRSALQLLGNNATVDVVGSTLVGNGGSGADGVKRRLQSADVDGGAVQVLGGMLLVRHSTLTANTGRHGGAVFVDGDEAIVRFEHSTLTNNSADAGKHTGAQIVG